MKTAINNRATSIFESAKRLIYSFQVLMVGVAIPVLFLIGISNSGQKPSKENETEQLINTTQLSSNQVVGFPVVKI